MTKQDNSKKMIAEVVGIMMMSRTYAHLAHLKTPSYAEHVALNDFYDAVVDQADCLAEAAQGKYGKLDIGYMSMKDNINKPADGLEKQLHQIKMLMKGCEGSVFISIMDNIEMLYLSTIYKLRELS